MGNPILTPEKEDILDEILYFEKVRNQQFQQLENKRHCVDILEEDIKEMIRDVYTDLETLRNHYRLLFRYREDFNKLKRSIEFISLELKDLRSQYYHCQSYDDDDYQLAHLGEQLSLNDPV